MSQQWLVTLGYVAIMFACAAIMKLSNVLLARPKGKERWIFLFFAPVLSLKSWRARRPLNRQRFFRTLAKGILFGMPLGLYYALGRDSLEASIPHPIARAYASILPFWCLVETAGVCTELSFAVFGIHLPAINKAPWQAQSTSDFWGKHWNRTFGDWFYQTCFFPLRRRPVFGMLLTFFLSGIIHELIVATPLLVVYGKNVFGCMMLYFGIQAFSVWFDRRHLRQPLVRRIFLWTCLLLPAPLLFNEGTRRIFHIFHG